MSEELYTEVELEDGTKWFIAAETMYNNMKYNYLVRLNDTEDDFLEEAKVVKYYFQNNEEYAEEETNQEILMAVLPILVPEAKEYIDDPKKLQELMQN